MSEQVQLESDVTPGWQPFAALFAGLMAVSTAAIFIRLAQGVEAGSLVIAASRLIVASLVLTPVAMRRYIGEIRQLNRQQVMLAMASGAVLGLHFAAWVTSLEYTSVVNSVVIVTTNPLWVAIMAPLFLSEALRRGTLMGLMLAFSGGILVAISGEAGDPPTRPDALLGNGLALIGALAAAIYFVIGRRLRADLSIIPYIWLVYSTGAITLMVVVLISGQPFLGLDGMAYIWMLLMGLIPQLIGHSSFNYALGFLPAAYVSLVVLGEPVGSGILAIIFLQEFPVPLQMFGAALILFGIFIASRTQVTEDAEEIVAEVEL